MSAIIHDDGLGVQSGLVVLRDVVSFNKSHAGGKSGGATDSRAKSESSILRVVCVNAGEMLER